MFGEIAIAVIGANPFNSASKKKSHIFKKVTDIYGFDF